jgi:plasmid stabilization system protein ParE
MRVLWTETAVRDLTAARDYIARDSEVYAVAFVERVLAAVEGLTDFPRSGRQVPEAEDPDIRETLCQDHRVMYRVREDAVQILAIVHGVRDVAGMPTKPWQDE